MTKTESPLRFNPTVAKALEAKRPVVAFETTILSHGLPWPENIDTAHACELIAENHGATPATLAIMQGEIRIGLEETELEQFCSPSDVRHIAKVNLQNFETVLHSGRPGALTVAGSLRACHCAGIPAFCTGGIGGVHRDYMDTLDESSDLTALARYPVATVCAGIKSILDVPATLERLETLGIPILGFGTDSLPCFYSADSPYAVTEAVTSIVDLARIVHGVLTGGRSALVVVPAPTGSDIPFDQVEGWIAKALDSASENNIRGKAVTPYLLQRMVELSSGRTLVANQALVRNNARVAAELAGAMAKIK